MGASVSQNRFILQWHITHRCNLRCAHCYQDDYSAFETKEHLKEVLHQYLSLLSELNMKGWLNVTGGEPLTHPHLFWLLEEARRAGLFTAVLTNGTLIGKSEAKRLKASGVEYVQVSLDGMRKNHDAIRGEGSFDDAVAGIRQLLAQNIFTSVSFTAQPGNLGSFAKLARFCRDIGVDKMWFDRVVADSGSEQGVSALTREQSGKLFRKAAKLAGKTPLVCIRSLQFLDCGSANVYRCSAGDSLLAVLADGSVMPCRRLPIVLGNVHDVDLLSLYRDNPVIADLRRMTPPQGCSSCQHAELCGGGAKCISYALHGRHDVPDPDCPLLT